jgi:predicted nucleic acid-binding protein
MKVLMDTSVLVAAVLPSHSKHWPSVQWLDAAKQGAFDLVISSHTIAELFAILTRMPARPRITARTAVQFVEDILLVAKPVTLSGQHYHDVVGSLAQQGLIGGVVYDAVIAKGAEIENADYLLTLNKPDFDRVWPAHVARIVSPETLSPPQLTTDH